MESNAGNNSPASTSNGLKTVFSRSSRSKTTVGGMEGPAPSSESTGEQLRPASSGGSNHHHHHLGTPSGFSKLIPGARRRQQKKLGITKTASRNSEKSTEEHGSHSGESKISLPSFEVNGQRRRSMTDPGSAPITDDESDAYSSFGPRSSHAGPPGTTDDPTASDPSVDRLGGNEERNETIYTHSSGANSESAFDELNTGRRNTLGGNSSKDTLGSSTGRKLKEAFTPRPRRHTQKSASSSPDRASIKSSGGRSGKNFLASSARRKSSFPSRISTKSTEDIPPVPTSMNVPKDTSTGNRQSTNDLPPIDTRPKTPPGMESHPGIMTTVTPPTPIDKRPENRASPLTDIGNLPESTRQNSPLPPNVIVSPSGNMISHRRVRSASAAHQPSKLSNSLTAPLTPTTEENNEFSPRVSSNPYGSSFFSSMFSAAQNAASTLSGSLNTQPRGRNGIGPVEDQKEDDASKDVEPSTIRTTENTEDEQKELAVDTLGMGDLNFSHLGLDAPLNSVVTTPDGVQFKRADVAGTSRRSTVSQRDELAARIEDERAAHAVSMAYENPSESSPNLPATANDTRTAMAKDGGFGDNTPPTGSIIGSETGESFKRTGSLRSRRRSRRQRGSSAATATTIGAIGAAAMGLGLPGHNLSVPRLTGFAVASKKRNRDFHQLFRSVPEDDYLIEDYSCALQREIILAGRIYISEGHICFSSNILGWVTTLVIGFDEVMAIEKESTAMVFPNAIAIQSLHARHTFRSLLSRDSTYDLMINIWKINHPTLKSSINGTQIAQGTGDKTEKADETDEESASVSEEEDEVYDEDEDGADVNLPRNGDESTASSDLSGPIQRLSRKSSTVPLSAMGTPNPNATGANGDVKAASKGTESGADYPGPKTHPPTEFNDPSGRYDKLIKDETIPAPLGRVYSLVFGTSSGAFISKFLLENQKVLDLQFEDDKKGLTNDSKCRSYNYIKPLNGSIGPKQTRCISSEQLDFFDLEKAVLVTLTTQTPDVPNGNVFSVKTKYLLTWGPDNSTRFYMSCTVEWTGKSWIKGPIEKGANDGQLSFGTDLVKALKAGIAPAARLRGATKAGAKGKGKRGRINIVEPEQAANSNAAQAGKGPAKDQGILASLYGPLSPIVDILKPLFSGNIAIGIICVLLVTAWFRSSSQPHGRSPGVGFPIGSLPERYVAYEELWQREESELWDWLEERVGLDGFSFPVVDNTDTDSKPKRDSNQARGEKEFATRLRDEKMSEREVEDAIRVTQQRLQTLQRVVEKQKNKRQAPEQSQDTTFPSMENSQK